MKNQPSDVIHFIKSTLLKSFVHILNMFSYIIPKGEGTILIWPVHSKNKMSGNLKELYLYITHNSRYKITWVVTEKVALNEFQKLGLPVIYQNFLSMKWIWVYLRVQVIVLDAMLPIIYGRFNVFQTWHGVGGPKNVALLNEFNKKRESLKRHIATYKFLLASSPYEAERARLSFGTEKVFITGSPRNDKLFLVTDEMVNTIKASLQLSDYNKILVYVPTFRDQVTIRAFDDVFWTKLNLWLVSKNYVFVIKKHPWDKNLDFPSDLENVIDLSKIVGDVQDLLIISDLLVSDYSSIVTDYSLLKRPIIFYTYDFEEYVNNCRSLNYDMKAILPGPFIDNAEELLHFIQNDDWYYESSYQKKYQEFLKLFNTYQDPFSAKRVFEYIQSTMNSTNKTTNE